MSTVRICFLAVLLSLTQEESRAFSVHQRMLTTKQTAAFTRLYDSSDNGGTFYNDFEGFNDDDEEDDDYIDTEKLGDWRTFRMNLATSDDADEEATASPDAAGASDKKPRTPKRVVKSVSKENEALLKTQSEILAREYLTGVWAHATSTPEVGGLVLRLPLEIELCRNTQHSLMGQKLRGTKSMQEVRENTTFWYRKAQALIEMEMQNIASQADPTTGQIDATKLEKESQELLRLFLENQATWQEVCLVTAKNNDEATTLVLNRPMAFQLTENLAELVLFGAMGSRSDVQSNLVEFQLAFGKECAVYVGGPDAQDQAATMIHGYKDLPGAVEISPGTNIYRGGVDAAIQGVLKGFYKPLDFRFFVGRHEYSSKAEIGAGSLDLEVLVGKYQPVAATRALALKQCISLPKPLWHEVLELCGGDLKTISRLEMENRPDLQMEIIDEDAQDEEDGFIEIVDELGELFIDEEDDEDDL